ncbi:MAG: efflux RND transporter permease subunit [Desulfobacula sp.]|jgi:hydrophobic/amphiphilic exporter-1 (mainly G- bacteria), HAE1 family|uniref:efflux RND transporter permease subunit n=1 Tax=Desulfobacula sp. TaxID=2593537 RepID=UPI001DF41D14|nr:efflux RND transporter permease subunit [Desulfobacula sp.]MBT3486314.1 efflux RND transporter permease subunit [Desulfobacula sp.]MBT4026125.1 efflux RND transporter permease subunit [Desulfobacula sp.]MBT4198046.1 efflux RND transporter permease subunit [Desulfobacula sp.]MBT4506556.1 efflux RND transporter permease subunit [Desulfobacula sp.]
MIRFFTGHPTAANLLMIIFLIAGTLSLPRILRETQPDFAPSEVEINIIYPGATAEQVDEGVCQRVEDAIDKINFVQEVRSDAREGFASIIVEMTGSGDIQTFIRDIETQINGIDDFPEEVEDPVISELGRTDPVISLLVSGPMSVPDLKTYCEDMKDRMQEAGIGLINIAGFSDHQLRVSLSEAALQRLGLSAAQVADKITAQNRDLPLGSIKTREQDILLRFAGQRTSPEALSKLIILATPQGGEIRLGEIARIDDIFELDEDIIMAGGQRSALLNIEKTNKQDSIRVATKVKNFITDEQERHPQMKLTITQDQTTILSDRLKMLLSNGIQGLLLVFLTMWLFFNIRISFWVSMGLPVSFLGAFIILPHLGLSINMFTMVGMLMALGLLMDDAIVIAENIMAKRQAGKSPIAAAVEGIKEVAAGVMASFLTTICILGPLAFIDGQIGKVLRVVPMMLILILTVSLIEAFWILPAHLNHSMHGFDPVKTNPFRQRFDTFFSWMRDRLVGRTVDVLLKWRYLFISTVIGVFILSLGLVASGKIKFQGFPDLEGDIVVARLLLPQGTPFSRTEAVVKHILMALELTNQTFKPYQPGQQDLIKNAYVQYNLNTEAFEKGSHVATITVDLLTAEKRSRTIDEFLTDWRKEIGDVPDLLSLTVGEPGFGPGGRPIEIRLRGKSLIQMKEAVAELKEWFSQFEGVVNLADDLRPGKPELRMTLREDAYGLGITAADVGRQLRAAFQGLVADEIQVGSESYEVDVRLTDMDRNSLENIENFTLVLTDGNLIPLKSVVTWEMDKGWARIARFNGMKAVTLRGDVDTRKINTKELIRFFQKTFLHDFNARYPDLKLAIAGSLEETNATQKSMFGAMLIGFIGIFILLSFQFRSFTEPIIVMVAIPFSLIGVVWGHGLMGVPISMPSLLGFVALGGIVVNDSILLVLFLKNALKDGLSISKAASQASRDRFRAVLLTSTTTIAGLMPLLFEKSLQAQILIPLVISTIFGLMASTVLVLLAIPCMYLILADLGIVEKIIPVSADPFEKIQEPGNEYKI